LAQQIAVFIVTGILRGLLDTCATRQHDQVSQRYLLAARLCAVELSLNTFLVIDGCLPNQALRGERQSENQASHKLTSLVVHLIPFG
jgi:hypothetical protein